MLEVEAALVRAAASSGLVPADSAARVSAACRVGAVDAAAVARGWERDATPVVALVEQLRALVDPGDARYVHPVATSQDVVDTTMTLVIRRAVDAVRPDLDAIADMLADLVARHRDTVQVGRTLLQHGAATTFGAAWAPRLVAIDDAATALTTVAGERLRAQLGGAVGTLAAAGSDGLALVGAFARELGLAEPPVPWHTTRSPVVELAAAIGIVCGELAGVAQDVVLLSATDIGEVRVAAPGGSSAMPGKRNPAPAVLALAAQHRVSALVATMLAAMPQELQRAAGRWQAEWATMTDLLRLLGGVARHTRHTLTGLEVDAERMSAAVARTLGDGPPDLGAAGAIVDRALELHRSRPRRTGGRS